MPHQAIRPHLFAAHIRVPVWCGVFTIVRWSQQTGVECADEINGSCCHRFFFAFLKMCITVFSGVSARDCLSFGIKAILTMAIFVERRLLQK